MNWSNNWEEPSAVVQQPKTLKDVWDSKSQDDVLMHWTALKKQLNDIKNLEMEFRKYVVGRAFPNAQEGTNTVELGNGYQLKAGVKFNYKLTDNDVVEKGLDELAHTGNDGSFIADRLVSWTPNFLLKEYRTIQEDAEKGSQLAKDRLKIISKFLTIEEAAPTLEIKEPKVKK